MKNRLDNVLLITYHPLKAINGGTKMYESILKKLGDFNLFWIATGSSNKKIPPHLIPLFIKVKFITSFIFYKNWLRVFTKFPFVFIHLFILYFIYTPYSYYRIKKTIKDENIDLVWIETFKQTYLLAYLIQKKLNVKLHLSFNDHYSAQAYYGEKALLNFLFRKIIKSNSSFDFISDGMLNYFKEKYHFNSNNHMILWLGVESKDFQDKMSFKNNYYNRIIFYGSIHGFDTFCKFCDAIAKYNSISVVKITLDIYSEMNYSFLSKKYDFVNFFGLLSESKLKETILKYDLVYVPMYFDAKNSIVAKTSISSKMILAINSGLPIFSHAPIDSANSIFVSKYNIGINCFSLDSDDIINCLRKLNKESNIIFNSNAKKVALDISNHSRKIDELKKMWF